MTQFALNHLIAVLSIFAWPVLAAAQIEPAADAPQPLSPAESRERFQLPDGFRIELVASEPLLADPSAILIDHAGRIFVSELHGYNMEGHLDIQRLNATGKLDREVRRVRVDGEILEASKRYRTGAIKQLFDHDHDGEMDEMRVWADGLPACYGMVAYRDGLIAVCAPHILFLADRDHDGVAEFRETLFTGFEAELMERAINNPIWGLDGWVYVATGNSSPIVTGPRLSKPVELGRSDFRFRPDGSAIEPVTGTNGTFGHTFNDAGDRFLISTTTPVIFALPLPRSSLARNPYVPTPGESIGAVGYHDNFPTSTPHPWRAARGADPNWVKFYGPQETRANGNFTSGCSPFVYRADAFPMEYQGSHFSCDPANNLVHRTIVERDGAGYRGHRATGEEHREFLTSTDQWCCPINLYLGPDGAMYIVDMYREIIEDYSAIPRFLQQQYGLIAGHDRGRIWRVVHESSQTTRWPHFETMSNAELAAHLDDRNAWWREHAQRLLVERRSVDVAVQLTAALQNSSSATGRLSALYTLANVDALDDKTLVTAISDAAPIVRRHAIRIAQSRLTMNPDLLKPLFSLVDDPDPQVRLEVAMALGESPSPDALQGLVRLAVQSGGEPWMDAAILSSCTATSHLLVQSLLPALRELKTNATTDHTRLLTGLAQCVGTRRHVDELGHLLLTIADLADKSAVDWQVHILRGMNMGLGRSKGRVQLDGISLAAVERLLQSSHPEVVRLTLDATSHMELDQSALMERVIVKAAATAFDDHRELADRVTAVELLANADWMQRSKLVELLNPKLSPELQLAAIQAIAARDDGPIAATLVASWHDVTPKGQETITDICFAYPERLAVLLDAIESNEIAANMISLLRRTQLVSHENETLRHRAEQLFGKTNDNTRMAVVARYEESLQLERDAAKGRQLFDKHCAQCHRLQDRGFAVGPDLTAAAGRADMTLLTDVLAPSSSVKPGYGVVTVVVDDGRSVAGVLADESATSVTIRREQGMQEVILRTNIEELRVSARSLMPDGLEQELSPQDFANLLGFLREAFGPRRSTGVVLFDEQEDFIGQLPQGDAVLELVSEAPANGDKCLRVTPLQRSNASIAGWQFEIVADPQPGQYRYMRWSWRSNEAHGMMIELASSGRWPAADSAQRRYFSGKNSSGWQANRVAAEVSSDWSSVTVDLYKDNGEFTLTGIAPTTMGGASYFDRIELLRALDEIAE